MAQVNPPPWYFFLFIFPKINGILLDGHENNHNNITQFNVSNSLTHFFDKVDRFPCPVRYLFKFA